MNYKLGNILYILQMSEKKTNRRDFLFTATYAVGAVGVGATMYGL